MRGGANWMIMYRIFASHRGAHKDCAALQTQALGELASLSPVSVQRWGGTAVSGAVQEYIEALLFQDYLAQPPARANNGAEDRHEPTMLSYEEVVARLPHGAAIAPPEDYLQGVLDFTGEVMRYGVTHTRGAPGASALALLRAVAVRMDELAPYADKAVRGFASKHKVLRESLAKMERQVYADALNSQQQQTLSLRSGAERAVKRARLERPVAAADEPEPETAV